MTRARVLAVLVVCAVVACGCGALPTPSGVKVVRTVGGAAADANDQVRVLPPGPAPDATPADVVTGFLDAESNSDQDDFAVAREYLGGGTPWTTTGAAQVYADPTTSVSVEGATATVTVTSTRVASVDAHGVYVPQSGAAQETYTVTQARGAWRISALPVGLRLTASGLSRTYATSTLWWFTSDQRRLVPEQRWLPQQATGRATQLVRALLGGPSAAYATAVRTAVPAGTTLQGSVVGDGEVAVDLSRDAAALTPGQAQQLLLQLAATLGDVAAVTGVRLLVDGQPLPAAGEPRRATVAEAAPYLPSAVAAGPVLVVTGGRAVTTPRGGDLPAPVAATLAHLPVTRAVASPDGSQVAVVTGEQVEIVRPDGAVRPVVTGADAALSWTQDGRLAVGLPTRLLLSDGSAAPTEIGYPAGLPGPVGDLRVALDGVRVVFTAGTAGSRRAFVALLVGAALTAPTAVLAPPGGDVTQVAWRDATDLAAVVTAPGRAPQLLTASVDGSGADAVSVPPAVGGDVALAAAPGGSVLVAGAGQVEELGAEGLWRPLATGSAVGAS